MTYKIKCKLCQKIIPYQKGISYCECGEVMLDGNSKQVVCKHNGNYMEVDDQGNEVVQETIEITKKDRLNMLEEMIKSYERLPQQALHGPINHYDFISALLLLSSILRED